MKNTYLTYGIIIILTLITASYFMSSQSEENNLDKTPESTTPTQINDSSVEETITTNILQKDEVFVAVMSTSMGDITIKLNSNDAPNTVANFVKLAKGGFYDGTKFHRVIPDFMVQGGDPLTKDDSLMGQWGTGGPGYAFEDEIHENNYNKVGTISMANSGPNTNGSQFFINVADNNFLDGKHTVFGIITGGMDVVNSIALVPTEGADRPVEAVIINFVTIK